MSDSDTVKAVVWDRIGAQTVLLAVIIHPARSLGKPTTTSDLSVGWRAGRKRKRTLPPPQKSMYINEASVSSVIYIPLLMNYCAACCFVLGAERLLHLADSHSHTKQGVLIKKWAAGSTPTRTNTPNSCARRPRGQLWRLSRSDGWVILRIGAWNHDTHTQLTCAGKGLCGLCGCSAQCLPVVIK